MSMFTRPNLRFHASPMIADQMRPVIGKLVAADDDGHAYRCAIRHWLWSERPVIEGFAGKHVALHVEGPLMDIGPHRFPMGSLISGISGWRRLEPVETLELVSDLRAEIDVTINRWLLKNAVQGPPIMQRPALNRAEDDEKAIAAIVAWARREDQIEALHAVQD